MARRRLKVLALLLAVWLLTHAGNFAAGTEFLPSNGPWIGRIDSVAATDLDAYQCPGCSVVLISIDTLRADHLGSYGYPRPTSPNIDEFADAATLFTTTIAPGSSTLISHASMMTSLLAFQHGARVRPHIPLADEALTIAEVLQGTGYQTAAFTAGAQLASVYGLPQGFDVYDAQAQRDLRETVNVAMAWLDAEPRGKFFLFLHTYEVHAPYTPHDRYWELLGADLSVPRKRGDARTAQHGAPRTGDPRSQTPTYATSPAPTTLRSAASTTRSISSSENYSAAARTTSCS